MVGEAVDGHCIEHATTAVDEWQLSQGLRHLVQAIHHAKDQPGGRCSLIWRAQALIVRDLRLLRRRLMRVPVIFRVVGIGHVR